MRRPLLIWCISLIVGILIEYYFMFKLVYILVFGIFSIFIVKRQGLIFIVVGMLILNLQISNFEKFETDLNKEVTVQGLATEVNRVDEKGGIKYNFILKNQNNEKFYCVFYKKINIERNFSGEEVAVKGILRKPTARRNPKCFDYNLYMRSKNIGYIIEGEDITFDNIDNMKFLGKIINKIYGLREEFFQIIDKNLNSKEASILKSLMFGSKNDLDEETYEVFQKNGTAHLLATSGLHVIILYSCISNILSGKRKIITNILICMILMIYVVMADFNPSIIRAVIMICVKILGDMLHYRYDILSAASLASIILLFTNPMIVFNIGFQMSFIAIFIIGVTFRELSNESNQKWFREKFISLLIIQGLMAPFIMYYFNYFSISALIANIPVTLVGTVLLPIGMIAFSFVMFMGDIPYICIEILEYIIELFNKVNEFTYMNGTLSWDTKSPPIFLLMLFYGLVFIFTSEEIKIYWIRGNLNKICVQALSILLLISTIAYFNINDFNRADVIFVDVGQGNAIIFRSKGKTILIDGGGKKGYDVGKKILKPMLLKNQIKKIDMAIVTHLDEDHYGGIKSLSRDGMIDKILIYEENKLMEKEILEECGIRTEQLLYGKQNDVIKINDTLKFKIMAPDKDKSNSYEVDENSKGIVCKAEIKGKTFLITGDIGKEIEKKLKGNLRSDVIQVPHHGSKGSSSDELLDKAKPMVGVVQVGKNNYGHPSPEVVEKYNKNGIIILRNDLNGAVGFAVYDGGLKIYQMIEEDK